MLLGEHYGEGKFGLSYEVFPPKTERGINLLMDQMSELMQYRPDFITCTYGAGGSTRNKTLETLDLIRKRWPLPCASHFTLVGSTAEDLRAYLHEATARDVNYIVALRGDPPKGQKVFKPVEGGFSYANELVQMIKDEFPQFGVAVAGYPETHIEATSPKTDIENLKRKVDAGADVIITQLFFDNTDFFRFADRCGQAGITVPVVPGILPVTNMPQVRRVAAMCGATFPRELIEHFELHEDDPVSQFAVGVHYSMRQVEELVEHGVPGMHFYVLNRSHATALICQGVKIPHHESHTPAPAS